MIYTSYYAKYKGDNGVAVSKSIPKWFIGKACNKLMPTWDMIQSVKGCKSPELLKDAVEKYKISYRKLILNKLNPEKIYKELDGKVLLCYEKPGDFCHRHLIAQWLCEHGFDVKEWESGDSV